MPQRTLAIDGHTWTVALTGRTTPYARDEIGLVFELGTGEERKRRYTRFAPTGTRRADAAFAELSDRQLHELFRASQPAWTAPESVYGVR